jgi:hypothetical protein
MVSGTGAHLSDIWGTSSSDVFAVGEEGTIYHYDGAVWSGMDAGWPGFIDSVWGSSSTDVYGGAEGNTLVHYDGTAWSELSVDVGPYYKAFIWGSSEDDVFVVGRGGGIWHYDGVTWSQMASGTTKFVLGVWGTASDNVFAVGSSGTILHYDGSAWSHLSSPLTANLSGVWAHSETDVFAAGGSVYHYDGAAWSPMNTGTLSFAQDVWGSAPDDVFVASLYGIHHYDGGAWSPMSTGTPTEPILYTIWGTSAADIFAAGEDGVIYHYDGSVWSPMASVASEPIYDLGGSSSDDVFAVGYMGLVYHFDGATWSPMASGTTQHLRDVWANSSTDVFAVGNVALHYDGSVWTEMDLPAGSGVWGASATNVYATYGGWVMHYDGTTWTQNSPWFGQNLIGVFGVSECDVFAVGNGGAIVRLLDVSPVPVLISRFEASARENSVELRWEISGDESVAGFRIYRSDDRTPIERRLGGDALIVPSAQRYNDTTVQPGMRYRYSLGVVDANGGEIRSSTTEIDSRVPTTALFQNHPNPFNPTTSIRFSAPEKTHVTLKIFNAEGKLIATLIDGVVDPGVQEIEWDGRDGNGHPVGSGIYFYRLDAGGRPLSGKMTLVK